MVVTNEAISMTSNVNAAVGPTGMALRVAQRQVDQVKNSMSEFFPHYMAYDMDLPKEYDWNMKFFFGLLKYTISWTNIVYKPPTLDIKDTELIFEQVYDHHVLKVNFPTLKSWKVTAHQNIDTIFPSKSEVGVQFKDFDIKFNCDFELTDKGFLKPVVMAADLKFGGTDFYSQDWFVEFLTFTSIKYVLIMI
jgi:hypothetical protein